MVVVVVVLFNAEGFTSKKQSCTRNGRKSNGPSLTI